MKLLLVLSFISLASAKDCNYSYSVWSVVQRSSVRMVKVEKKYQDLTKEEIDKSGCSACEEDQVAITLKNKIQFKVCKILAGQVEDKLNKLIDKGHPIVSVVGYRPQMSRGDVNASGERTQLSNHSFGSAIDINERFNGLYDQCIHWSPECRLIRGGAYIPGAPNAISAEDNLVKAFDEIGFKWGGQIKGRQKDFMHFSLTGY